ncbi:hypothetical protein M422DRAFT_247452, partial [Sphaerobolus stellatus SS14]
EAQVLVDGILESTGGFRILTRNDTENDVLVDSTEVAEWWCLGLQNEVVLSVVNAGRERVLIEEERHERIYDGEVDRCWLTEETGGHHLQVKEVTSGVDGELTVVEAAIDEEDGWEYGFGIGGENT